MRKQTNDKLEKLTPEQIWKNASKILRTKKKEPVQNETQKQVDFKDIFNKLTGITNERIQKQGSEDTFIKNELKNSLFHIPDWSTPQNTCINVDTPLWFPITPLKIFNSPDIYKKLDLDTLFFIFYKETGTEHQYYAACQLKMFSWRFHTKYYTWFQRLDEPKLITVDYERGDFLFFDFDVTWSFMKKTNFTFEYKYLEDIDL